ncbi:46416_t:CDS:2 [Gigaspora margarita]|uniref:46416_t:CDS:1 n=1 Tax=Gigaspora margarita TaxID=4874 RepID=A0ABN7ULG1_GIGMA|nr:46416_t:CDS:2 [Gigaspora margarita]
MVALQEPFFGDSETIKVVLELASPHASPFQTLMRANAEHD